MIHCHSTSFYINIIIYYQYVVNLKQGKPTFCCWICSQELRRQCCESPCTCGRWGMPRSHDVSQIHEVRLCQSQLFEGCVFVEVWGYAVYVTSSRSTCFWVEASSSRGLWKPPLFGVLLLGIRWLEQQFSQVITGSNLLGTVGCFITRSAGILHGYMIYFSWDDQ